jgi:hypothetical protein
MFEFPERFNTTSPTCSHLRSLRTTAQPCELELKERSKALGKEAYNIGRKTFPPQAMPLEDFQPALAMASAALARPEGSPTRASARAASSSSRPP